VIKADTHYPYVRLVGLRTGRLHGPYVWVSKNVPVRTARLRTGAFFDTRAYGPYVRVSKNAPVHTGRKDVRVVRTGSAYRP